MGKSRSDPLPAKDEAPVMISVTGMDATGEQIVLQTRGVRADIPGGWMLSYEETHPESLITAETMVECQGNSVTVLRAGDVVSTIVYRQGETFAGEYETPVGWFVLRVFATEVSVRCRGNMGHIHLAYQVSLSSSLSPTDEMAMRWLDIRFRPCAH